MPSASAAATSALMAPWPTCSAARASCCRRARTRSRLLEVALEAGAEDVETADDGSIEVTTAWEDFSRSRRHSRRPGLEPESGEVTMVASTTVPVDVRAPRR
jgi:transcriptional/translational regulatory protein YebC/TACO1